jgi:DNA-binding PadR family transcriptional regulator
MISPTEPESAPQSSAPIKLTPHSYLVLGMVRLGVNSGYTIKKVADRSTQNFWPISLAQVYPELARLEKAGLLTRSDNPHGGRNRSAYAITDRGEEALRVWLRSPTMVAPQMRDEALLRVFFADALEGQDQLKLIGKIRERNHSLANELRTEIIPAAESFEELGIRYLAISARFLGDFMAFAEGWTSQLEAKLEAEQKAEVPRSDRSDSPR